jgi:hypothetical protein
MLSMPFIFFYDKFQSAVYASSFVTVAVAVIGLSLLLAFAGMRMNESENEKIENYSVFAGALAVIAMFSIFSIPILEQGIFLGLGIALCYVSLCGFFAMVIYLIQMLPHKNEMVVEVAAESSV